MDCVAFLQWALPRLDLHWPGFRKVRGQVCKRVKQRLKALQLDDFVAYRARLEADQAEWKFFDDCCHITISRFFRDRGVFEFLRKSVLPNMASRAKGEGREVRIWSAGCASGEEPYTLKVLWDLEIANSCPGVSLAIVATDIDATMLSRAQAACFEKTSLHELPPHLIAQAFDCVDDQFCIKSRHRDKVEFARQDLRTEAPSGRFDLILCRYVAFTYFAPSLQQRVLARILERLLPYGYLVIGTHERLPGAVPALIPTTGAPQIFQSANRSDLEIPRASPVHD